MSRGWPFSQKKVGTYEGKVLQNLLAYVSYTLFDKSGEHKTRHTLRASAATLARPEEITSDDIRVEDPATQVSARESTSIRNSTGSPSNSLWVRLKGP